MAIIVTIAAVQRSPLCSDKPKTFVSSLILQSRMVCLLYHGIVVIDSSDIRELSPDGMYVCLEVS